ncbi:DUF1648 domain-containing protein [Aureitalea marina]|uniref:DUF1648 domain-containing protein n=1 Tax=Aureitalea marina TaxID=930804 RepID=A0A2S7KS35_9FLAO|nr:DUF1648 domain-containing protein [Aureitalea marina]PQB05388.1 hypothetical protein BST85_11180 [Aureitalea marina]
MNNKNRPKVRPELETADILIEMIGLMGLLVLIGLPLYYYPELPDQVPHHYGADGVPDRWGGKGIVWTLPAIGAFLYAGLWYLNRFPHIFNYMVEITQQNAIAQYRLATRLIRSLNAFTAWLFAYINYAIVQGGLKGSFDLGMWFLPTLIGGMLLLIVVFMYRATKA